MTTTVSRVDREGRWSVGTLADGRHVLSIPVANRLVDYEENYLLTEDEYAAMLAHPAFGLALADRCRARSRTHGWSLRPAATAARERESIEHGTRAG